VCLLFIPFLLKADKGRLYNPVGQTLSYLFITKTWLSFICLFDACSIRGNDRFHRWETL